MEEWLIISMPQYLIPIIIAVVLNLYDRLKNRTKGILTILALIIMLVVSPLLFLSGANLYEIIILLLVFLIINMGEKV